jgi:hypothetical protein
VADERLLTYSTPHWPDSRWAVPVSPTAAETAFSFEWPNYLDVDGRALMYVFAYAPPKKLGAATFYVGTYTDAKGDLLRGGEATSCTFRPMCRHGSSGR